MAKRRKSAKQIKLERELAAANLRRKKLRAALKAEKKTSKKVIRQTKRVFKQTEKRRRQINRYKPKRRKPLLPRLKITYRQKKRVIKKRVIKKRQKILITKKERKQGYRIINGKKYSKYQYHKKFGKLIQQGKQQRGNLGRYYSLLRDFMDKQESKGNKLTRKEAMNHPDMHRILVDLYHGMLLNQEGEDGNKYLLKALKRTTRRDGIPDNIPVGESPK